MGMDAIKVKKNTRQLNKKCECGKSFYVNGNFCNICGIDRSKQIEVEYEHERGQSGIA